jgi:hypothetical protein
MVRALIAAVIALLLSVTIVRNAAVSALAAYDPAKPARVWPNHPDVRISDGMIAIAFATHRGTAIPPDVLESIYHASFGDSLAVQPFLVRGVQAQLAGDDALARQAFVAAQWREPRSLPAHFFLAEDAFRRGDSDEGLDEVVALARLAPNGAAGLSSYLARYAIDRSNWPRLRDVFRSDPALANATFDVLAQDPNRADVILALSDERQRDARSPWVQKLLGRLVEVGQYEKARALWAAVSHVRPATGSALFDPAFSQAAPPPPFNWDLTSSTVGLAERRPNGGLHVIYYGQEDGVLASQLVVTPAGNYRLTMHGSFGGSNVQPLRWRLMCVPSGAEIATASFNTVVQHGLPFTVPPSCRAVRLELFGVSSDIPQQLDVTVDSIALTKGQGSA